MRMRLTILIVAALGWSPALRAETPAALTERLLIEGKLAEGEKALSDVLATHPDDAQARFGLGTVQFLRAVERLVQAFHRYGFRAGVLGSVLPFERLPIPPNEHPEPI